MSPRRHKAASSMTAAAMPLEELERWLQARIDQHPAATNLLYAAMRLKLLAWAPLLDASNVNHGLLLPILLHCRDDQGRPLLGPPRSSRETNKFLRNAHADIPAAVEALRQYWMPIRYARTR